jgi:hypothetical protein
MGVGWKIAQAAEILGLVLFLLRQALEESLLSLFLGPGWAGFCALRFFVGSNRGNRLADHRFVLLKGFPARLADSKMLLQPLLFFPSQLARGRNGAEF